MRLRTDGASVSAAEIGVSPRLTADDWDGRMGIQRMAAKSGDTATVGTHQFRAASDVRVPCFEKRTNVSRIQCLVEFG